MMPTSAAGKAAVAGVTVGWCFARFVIWSFDENPHEHAVKARVDAITHMEELKRSRSSRRPASRWSMQRVHLDAAYAWASATMPYFECSDADITSAYFYRLRVLWLHVRRTPAHGEILTEFLRDVPWSGPSGTINCAFGHHAADARWMREPALLDNYSRFWFNHPKADRRYTWWPAHAALERYRLDGRVSMLRELRPHLLAEYRRWVETNVLTVPGAKAGDVAGECLWQACHDDGEENSIGFDGCRPSINAAMYGEANALATIATLLGDAPAAAEMAREAARWRTALHALWSPALNFFVTRTLPPPASRREAIRTRRTKVGCLYCPPRPRVRHGDTGSTIACPPQWPTNELVTVRELAGLSWPWYHRAATPMHAIAWRQIRQRGGFRAAWGLRTAERRHPCFNFSTWCPTSWHGPVWPFESSKLATGLIHALHDDQLRAALRDEAHVTLADFHDVLADFARMHTRGRARDVPDGQPFVGESFHGEDGYWLTRELLYQRKQGDRKRGDHYLHSSYVDLVLGGLCGLHVTLDDAAVASTLVIEPLFSPTQIGHFAAVGVRVHGRDVDVAFDIDGTHYGGSPGLAVWLDGQLAAHMKTLGRLEVPLGNSGPG